jgi:hypothetical protein
MHIIALCAAIAVMTGNAIANIGSDSVGRSLQVMLPFGVRVRVSQ